MRGLAASLGMATILGLALVPPARAQDPAMVLDVYLDCLTRGDLDGALGYCSAPGGDANAVRQLRGMMDGISSEVDLLGVARALSLFTPLSPAPMEWRVKPDSFQSADEAMLSLTATTTLTFDQKAWFVRGPAGWQLDIQRTFADNAQGTKIERLLATQATEAQGRAQLARIGEALRRYGEANRWVFPAAKDWREKLLAFADAVTSADFLAPGESQPSYAMNENLVGAAASQIQDPGGTVLLFDAQPGVAAGGPATVAYRHGGWALVLTAKGEILRTRNAGELKWGARPLGASGGGSVLKPVLKDGRELVPLRDVLAGFGGKVTWQGEGAFSLAEALGHKVEIRAGDSGIKVDGQPVAFGPGAQTIDGTLYVPVGLPSRAFGLSVQWVEGGIEYR